MYLGRSSHLTVDPHLNKRAATNREKIRFCSIFTTLISMLIPRLPLSESDAVLTSETGATDGDLFGRFVTDRRREIMAMSMYLIPMDQVRAIVVDDFKALAGLFDGCTVIRLDTKNLWGDEGIVYCDEESDRYLECWRRVVKVFNLCGGFKR